jgi:ABC-type transport system involved in multi-copper enzyme maturation permease subunit
MRRPTQTASSGPPPKPPRSPRSSLTRRFTGVPGLSATVRAELLRLAKWPTTWIITGVWLALDLTFGYVIGYLQYRSAADSGDRSAAMLLAELNLDAVPQALTSGLPMFGGALVLVMGALATGSGYGWGTWKTVFSQGPGRRTALSGTTVALGLWLACLVLLTLVLDVGASTITMAIIGEPVAWPTVLAVLQGVGAALLIAAMWTAGGALVGVLARGPALSVGLGLVWALVVENLLRAVASALGPLEVVTDHLPGTAAGSLAGALGSTPVGTEGGTPGVLTTLSGTSATVVLSAYVVGFVAALLIVVSRRDA